ncbi:MAG: ABC transporter ATP-binding protein [Thermodesulfobacteriota bacterium]|nr:ABC transporter ATP-binding protein [Thermodesulfobacteriota bacterium]
MLFEITNLTKVYGDRTVLNISELNFEKRVIYALQGPNGSGKTTLLEILSLLNSPTSGKVKFNNRKVDFTATNLSFLRREIVMVQQNPVLFTTTVYKNLEFGLKVRKISKKKRVKIIEESLDMVGMLGFIDSEAHKLSGGETQRVAIAQALACSPSVMFFDEPTANVDVENHNGIERILMDINTQNNVSIIFTTHDHILASSPSRKIISLFEGRITSSIFENIFSGRIVMEDGGRKLCLVRDNVELRVNTDKKGIVKLSIDPFKINILTGRDVHPKRNIFKGKIVQLTDEHDYIRAVINIGIPLNIFLQRNDVRKKVIYVGDDVRIFLPVEAIQLF